MRVCQMLQVAWSVLAACECVRCAAGDSADRQSFVNVRYDRPLHRSTSTIHSSNLTNFTQSPLRRFLPMLPYRLDRGNNYSAIFTLYILQTRMWANAQPDGCPAKHRWRPLFNAAKFG